MSDDDEHTWDRTIRGSLFGEPDNTPRKHYRRRNPETSRDAATDAMVFVPESCRRVYEYLQERGGRTDREGKADLKMNSYRRRRADLKNAELVADGGERRDSKWGKAMTVWVLTGRKTYYGETK